jgi:hypothetical protein
MNEPTTINLFDYVLIPPSLTTDPFNKRGQIGIVIKIENETLTVEFENLDLGLYQSDALVPSTELEYNRQFY